MQLSGSLISEDRMTQISYFIQCRLSKNLLPELEHDTITMKMITDQQ